MTDIYKIAHYHKGYGIWFNEPNWKEYNSYQDFGTYEQALNWIYSQFILVGD